MSQARLRGGEYLDTCHPRVGGGVDGVRDVGQSEQEKAAKASNEQA